MLLTLLHAESCQEPFEQGITVQPASSCLLKCLCSVACSSVYTVQVAAAMLPSAAVD
jgi:hypothetical protein